MAEVFEKYRLGEAFYKYYMKAVVHLSNFNHSSRSER
jgi:hypothetical protein